MGRPARLGQRIAVIAALAVLVLLAVAIVDYIHLAAICRDVSTTASGFGAHVGSIGGWPFGREYVISLDRPLSDDELRRLAVATSVSPRIYVCLIFHCMIRDDRLDEMRRLVAPNHVTVIADTATERDATTPDR